MHGGDGHGALCSGQEPQRLLPNCTLWWCTSDKWRGRRRYPTGFFPDFGITLSVTATVTGRGTKLQIDVQMWNAEDTKHKVQLMVLQAVPNQLDTSKDTKLQPGVQVWNAEDTQDEVLVIVLPVVPTPTQAMKDLDIQRCSDQLDTGRGTKVQTGVQVWNAEDAEDEVLAMVCRTGLNTQVGSMVRELIAPTTLPREKDTFTMVGNRDCAVLRCAVLGCAVLCCCCCALHGVVLGCICCVGLCLAVLCCTFCICCALLCCAVLCHAALC